MFGANFHFVSNLACACMNVNAMQLGKVIKTANPIQEHRVPGHNCNGERLRHPAHLVLQEDGGRTDRVSEDQKEALDEGWCRFQLRTMM